MSIGIVEYRDRKGGVEPQNEMHKTEQTLSPEITISESALWSIYLQIHSKRELLEHLAQILLILEDMSEQCALSESGFLRSLEGEQTLRFVKIADFLPADIKVPATVIKVETDED